ncbi:Calmodulin-lysine N-methyltransferase [Amphibalanus amphitrite]|uniref:Calmodulin-lysine N-methyltransferase n=1 Tax=Amphibalanus amphitrite TaxID=1232801 RepID=A0A6A4VGY7_AMPAM|nr:Calmodulin-lysine N-methyltransferase [Amphibalanus amphitrite]
MIWDLLLSDLALRRREAPVGSRSVVRQFQSLGVFDVSGGAADADGPWMTYRLPGGAGPGLQIRHVERRLSASDLVGFNNTGNVAASTAARRVLLTDGNETAVQNVRCICERNRALFGATAVDVSRLRWTDPADVAALQDQCDVILSADWSVALRPQCDVILSADWSVARRPQCDVILSADCLFFDDARDSLADFIVAVLRPGHRSDPTFDPNLHLPVLLELTKPLRGAC